MNIYPAIKLRMRTIEDGWTYYSIKMKMKDLQDMSLKKNITLSYTLNNKRKNKTKDELINELIQASC